MSGVHGAAAAAGLALSILLLAGCETAATPEVTQVPGPASPSPGGPAATPESPVPDTIDPRSVVEACQPFPDHPFELFLEAYRSRNEERLNAVMGDATIIDPTAHAYTSMGEFASPTAWAKAGWRMNDRFEMQGYNPGFDAERFDEVDDSGGGHIAVMYASRSNDQLAAVGIEAVETTYAIEIDHDCHVTRVEAFGEVWSVPEPCAFAHRFLDEEQQRGWSPRCVEASLLGARTNHHAAVIDSSLVVLGGTIGGHFGPQTQRHDGARYDLSSRSWTPMGWPAPEVDRLDGAWAAAGAVIAVGVSIPESYSGEWERSFFRWTPEGGWSRIAEPPEDAPPASAGVAAGEHLVLWGGHRDGLNDNEPPLVYSPSEGRWRLGEAAPVGRRWWHTLVWTGNEVIAWGGTNARSDLATGAAYDPFADEWREIPPAPIAPRQWHSAVWTGTEMVVWGGSSISSPRADGAAYDPATNDWRVIADSPLAPRQLHTAVWTDTEMVVWGGYDYRRGFADGAAYDPERDSWRPLPAAPLAPRCGHTANWVGDAMIVLGGRPCDDTPAPAHADGAAYDPQTSIWDELPEIDRQ